MHHPAMPTGWQAVKLLVVVAVIGFLAYAYVVADQNKQRYAQLYPAPPTPAPTENAQPFADCILDAATHDQSMQGAFTSCDWRRPQGMADQQACSLYVMADLYYHKGYSKEATESAAAAKCFP